MSDTPDWLRRLMERDPRADGATPLDDLTMHRMGQYLREQGRLESEREERRLSILWPHWGLARHALSARAMRLAAPLIEDMSVDGG
jgi:DNA-binding IclR family transcriptional regulator